MPGTTVTSADGTTLAARTGGAGSPMVLVHGGLGDLDTFALIEGALAERHTVWVYSRRGRGGSGDGADHSLEREVEDVCAVVEAAGGDAHLVGHSAGATFALLAARRLPSLGSLTLYEPPLHVDRVDPGVVDAVKAAVEADDLDRAIDVFAPVAGMVREEMDVLRSMAPVWERLRAGVRLLPRENDALLEAQARLDVFAVPDVPTLYLYGERNDADTFPTVDEVGELFPQAEVQALTAQRHLAFAFDPAAFAEAVVKFTAAHDQPSR